jgi:hypothetical protein
MDENYNSLSWKIHILYWKHRWRLIWLLDKITDGRPMECFGLHFPDVVSGKPVYRFRDLRGRWWMAEHKWALFRVPLEGYA